jgi:uncharacterized repeat protein (TIGR03806 family)
VVRKLLTSIVVAVYAVGCAPAKSPDDTTTASSAVASSGSVSATPQKPYKSILDYGLFDDTLAQTPAPGVIAYSPINGNFADYATVRRFIKLPEGSQMVYDDSKPFTFPQNTIIAQSFSFPKDRRNPSMGEELIETRILIRRGLDGWEAVPYVWNDEKTDARRSVGGAIKDVTWIHDDGSSRELSYLVPNANQCVRCHENNAGYIVTIGTTARNLNQTIQSSVGDVNQLRRWSEKGILTGLPEILDDIPRLSRWTDPASGTVQSRARAYLDINCSFCHNPDGHGSVSGLDLRFNQENPIKYGVYKPPVAAGRGSEGLKYSIHPGNPDESFVIRRLMSTDPSIMMPPVGRRTASIEAVTLIQEWIAEMSFSEEEAAQLIVEQKEKFQEFVDEGTFFPEQ